MADGIPPVASSPPPTLSPTTFVAGLFSNSTIKESVATSRDRHPLLDRCSVRYDKRRNKVLLKWTADCTHVHTAPRMNERMNAPQAERKKGSRGERERRRIMAPPSPNAHRVDAAICHASGGGAARHRSFCGKDLPPSSPSADAVGF